MNRIVFSILILGFFCSAKAQNIIDVEGALVRSDTLQKNIFLCFTGHDYYEGFDYVLKVLKTKKIKASFFFTGDFVRSHKHLVKSIINQGHYVGAHSDKHLLYCDWSKRDSLLYSTSIIKEDISRNIKLLNDLSVEALYFMPPYEWYNKKVVEIANELNLITINYSSGTRSNADYTTPDMSNYISSEAILKSIYEYEKLNGMNGFHLLIHPGTNPLRKDKLYLHLDELISYLMNKGYDFKKF
ncbi:polysaccharide deacetylase family protein [Gaetbulibacter sp. M235]|uniref:polysaccharide deacetylase family protein n=1 Tax=Gaetbulibacter sp. M235 TaxID=3126510 RepID=UPI00374E8066